MTYRTKVRTIEAFQWNGQPRKEWPEWAMVDDISKSGSALYLHTASGPLRVHKGSWLILEADWIGVCTNGVFHERYEAWMPEIKQTVEQVDVNAAR